MKIAHLFPHSTVLPLAQHNGRYEWALNLARMQSADGNDVTIYCAPESHDQSTIKFKNVSPCTNKNDNNLALIKSAFSDKSFDIYHSHFDSLPHTLANLTVAPLVTTQHWFPDEKIAAGLRSNLRQNALAVPLTSLMRQKDEDLGIPHGDFIYHGVEKTDFPYSNVASGGLLFVGRITPQKGVAEAIRAAIATESRLDIVGKIKKKDQEYWNSIANDVDGSRIRYLGEKSRAEVAGLMGNSRALLLPTKSPEAFGLVTIEAQSCGTPVILSDVGASSELVVNGKTGFIASSHTELIRAIESIDHIERFECRKNAERFDVTQMYQSYIDLYTELLNISPQ